ncbi:BON domain-containing protein [Variovorax sp. OV329]|uniref:BON domain-containing protein n=1 Tax=Variovorax sp. OV329 TaxID=1882825 RepID=UPI0020C88FAB|nr:BON domain-containing protein [Variovorax sp. OV329]
MRNLNLRTGWLLALVGAGALTLAGCDRNDNRTTGEKVDAAIAKTERAADQAAAKTEQMAKDAREKMNSSDAGARVSEAAKDAGRAISNAADDASITAAVNAGLAKDPDLSAVKIDVDTSAGKVTLRGPAPTPMAKERAEQIAKDVKGVSSVDNQLEVKTM